MNKTKRQRKKENRKKRRIKRPELGRTKSQKISRPIKNPFGIDTKPKPCSVCKKRKVNHTIIGGGCIKAICECNMYLIEKTVEKVRQRNHEKRLKKGQIRILKYTP